MNPWPERIKEHQVFQKLEDLGRAIDNAVRREDIEPAAVDDLERLRTILTYTGKRLDATDPALLYTGVLDGIRDRFGNAAALLQAFVGDGNRANIANATTEIETVLPELCRLLGPVSANELAGLREAADSYRSTLRRGLEDVHSKASQASSDLAALQSKAAELSASIDGEKTRLSSMSTEFQSQFSAAQEARQSQFSTAQEARINESAGSEKDRQDKFTGILVENDQRLKDEMAHVVEERDQERERRKAYFTQLEADYADAAKSVLGRIANHEKEVEKLVGVIGNLGVTSGYQKAADEARKKVNIWQVVAVGALLAVITFAFLAFLPSLQKQTVFSWPGFAGRIFLTLAVGVLAGYAAAEAARYQDVERRNRRRALELEAIGPYLAPLPEKEQVAVRVAIAQRSFGIEEEPSAKSPEASPTNVAHLLSTGQKDVTKILELLVEAIKAAKK